MTTCSPPPTPAEAAEAVCSPPPPPAGSSNATTTKQLTTAPATLSPAIDQATTSTTPQPNHLTIAPASRRGRRGRMKKGAAQNTPQHENDNSNNNRVESQQQPCEAFSKNDFVLTNPSDSSTVPLDTNNVQKKDALSSSTVGTATPPPATSAVKGGVEKRGVAKCSAGSDKGETGASCEVRVAIIGNVDSGKSTLLGCLTRHVLDDGRGAARARVFNYAHELENGRTSSIAHELMGFNTSGAQVVCPAYAGFGPAAGGAEPQTGGGGHVRLHQTAQTRDAAWHYIVDKSERLVSFFDLCGHEKYLKTTIFGLLGCFPDYAMIVVGGNMGIQRMTREHLGIAITLKVPIFAVVTKCDLAPPDILKENIEELSKLLKSPGAKKLPLIIKDIDEATAAASSILSDRITPIFRVSNVNGEGLDCVRAFLRQLVSRQQLSGLYGTPKDATTFYIDQIFQVTGVGVVVSGTVQSGTITSGQQLLLGPDRNGNFKPVLVRSMHHLRQSTQMTQAGQSSALAIRSLVKKDVLKRYHIRKGMVLVDKDCAPKACHEFVASVVILHHSTTLRPRYQAVVHCGVVRQSAQVVELTGQLLRSGDHGTIKFRFLYNAEFVCMGAPLLFREGRTKGFGRIISLD